MAQKYFELQHKCDMLTGRNADLLAENESLKKKNENLLFEIHLLKDFEVSS